MSDIPHINWFKKAMPLLDHDIDGNVFDANRPYSPDKADFVETPFVWLSNIHNGDLSRKLDFILKILSDKYPHLPAAKIAASINTGVTRKLQDICSTNFYNENKLYFNCKDILQMSPLKEEDSDYIGNIDELASIVQDKLDGYFNYYR